MSAQGGWEFNGGAWNSRASSWVVGAVARINLFHGFADKARLAEAREQATRRALEREQGGDRRATRRARRRRASSTRRAPAKRSAARPWSRRAKAGASSAIATRPGLTDVASLLRAAEAVVQAETQQIAAQVAVLTETAALQRALGRR